MTTPRLLPCPCCGGPADFIELECGGQVVACTEKNCVGSGVARYACGDGPRALLASAWNNRRPIEHSQVEVLRKVERMAAYYEAPKGFFDWLDLQVTLHGGTQTAPERAGFRIEVTPANAPEASQ